MTMTISPVPADQLLASAVGDPTAPPSLALQFSGLRKHFTVRRTLGEIVRAPFAAPATVVGLNGASGEVRSGELFGVLGPNGAGKTTLFRILATNLLPDEGTASVAGHDVKAQAAAARRKVAYVMANERTLYWRLSARENLRLFATLHGLPTAERDHRVTEALDVVELADAAERDVGTLSSGMRQRVLLARALMVRPAVLLLDEPTRSLDPVSARVFRTFVRERIIRQLGCTVVVPPHDGDEAFDWCDRVMVLHQGRTLAVGAAEAMAHRFGDATMGVWTATPAASVFEAMRGRGLVHEVSIDQMASIEGWTCVRLRLPNGPEAAAAVFRELADHGVPVSRFERLVRSLADLLDRVVGADTVASANPSLQNDNRGTR